MKYLPLIITILLILAACAQPEKKQSAAKELAEQLKEQAKTEQPAETPVPAAAKPEEPVAEKSEVPAEAPKQQAETVEPEKIEVPKEAEAVEETVSPSHERTKMYKLLDIFAEKVTGYQFEYKDDDYYVKGTRYKVILDSAVIVKDVSFGDMKKSLFYYDTIYVDRATKTAIAYCEGHDSQINTQCGKLGLYDLAYPVPFKNYDITLPEDWLFTYLDKEPNTWDENKFYIQSRASITVTFSGDPELELNFDSGSGLVLRADQKRGNQLVKREDYLNLATNLVRDVDVNHRSKSEIPSSETFHK